MQADTLSKTHHSSLRIYYEDTDLTGAVYHANYLRYFERARSDFLREAGLSHRDLLNTNTPLCFAVRSLEIEYDRPLYIEDVIEIYTSIIQSGGAYIDFRQKIMRDQHRIAQLTIRVVGINKKGRIQRFSKQFRNRIEEQLETFKDNKNHMP